MRKGLLFRGAAIRRPCRRPSFNPKSFLAKVGEGRSIHAYPEAQIVFSQGDPADAVFYIQKGKVKITVVSKRVRKPSLQFLVRTISSEKDVWPDRGTGWQRP